MACPRRSSLWESASAWRSASSPPARRRQARPQAVSIAERAASGRYLGGARQQVLPDAHQCLRQRPLGGGKAHADAALSGGAEGGAGRERHTGVAQEVGRESYGIRQRVNLRKSIKRAL